jgi:hypothetical protein
VVKWYRDWGLKETPEDVGCKKLEDLIFCGTYCPDMLRACQNLTKKMTLVDYTDFVLFGELIDALSSMDTVRFVFGDNEYSLTQEDPNSLDSLYATIHFTKAIITKMSLKQVLTKKCVVIQAKDVQEQFSQLGSLDKFYGDVLDLLTHVAKNIPVHTIILDLDVSRNELDVPKIDSSIRLVVKTI